MEIITELEKGELELDLITPDELEKTQEIDPNKINEELEKTKEFTIEDISEQE